MASDPVTAVLELWELGMEMRKERFRESHPDADEAAIHEMVIDALCNRPCDADAVPRATTR